MTIGRKSTGRTPTGQWNHLDRITRTSLCYLTLACTLLNVGLGFPRTPREDRNPQATHRQIALTPCAVQPHNLNGTLLCGTYDVYENRAIRSGRKISLNLEVLPALDAVHAPDPVFWLNGGPGAAATDSLSLARNGLLSVLRRDHDLVFVDQRGTGNSHGLFCDFGADPSDMPVYYGRLFPIDLVRACREKLEQNADLRFYATSVAMDDLDEVREALGYSKIDLVGGSYGSIAAQVFIRQHPDSVRAAFLVGAATPAIKQPLLFLPAAQHALDLLFVDCAADASCNAAFPNFKAEFYAVLSRLELGAMNVTMVNPATKKTELVRLERENYVERIRLMLFTTTMARYVPLVVHRAYENDFLPFEAIANANNTFSTLAIGMYLTVTCSEGVPFISDQDVLDAAKGSFVGEARVRAHIAACKQWPRADVPPSFIDPVKSELPVIMFSGQADGSASPDYAARAVKYLPNGTQILVRYYGHQIDSPCEWQIMRDFISRGSIQGIDMSCVNDIRRPPFALEIPAQYSLQAKQ